MNINGIGLIIITIKKNGQYTSKTYLLGDILSRLRRIKMTNKETMEKLKYSIEPNQGFIELRKQIEGAIKMAIEALEKQIPEIPDYEGDGYADGELVYDTWICPRCGRHYEIDYDHYVYCPECGQRIDFDYGDE